MRRRAGEPDSSGVQVDHLLRPSFCVKGDPLVHGTLAGDLGGGSHSDASQATAGAQQVQAVRGRRRRLGQPGSCTLAIQLCPSQLLIDCRPPGLIVSVSCGPLWPARRTARQSRRGQLRPNHASARPAIPRTVPVQHQLLAAAVAEGDVHRLDPGGTRRARGQSKQQRAAPVHPGGECGIPPHSPPGAAAARPRALLVAQGCHFDISSMA